MYWHDHDMSTAGEAAMWIMMGLFWVAVAAVLIWAVRGFPAQRRERRDGAQEILDRRLASGEIEIEQYSQLRDALEGRSQSQPG